MAATAVLPATKTTLRTAVDLAAVFALLKLAIQVGATAWTVHLGWGYFRDEFYYIMCGRLLAWGYVDQGPMVALQARLGLALFGKSIVGIRMFAALAGAAKVFLTGLLAWSLGGRRAAQALAMTAVLVAPCYMGLDSFLSMNAFEPVFWMGAMLAAILLARGESLRWWLFVGLCAGLGLENKPSMTFYLVALIVGMLLTPQRRLLFNRWFAAASGLTVLLALPNLIWQVQNHWPTMEFLHNDAVFGKNIHLSPPAFLLQQILALHPLNVLVWLPGLVWLLIHRDARTMRWIGICYLVFLGTMMALHGKDYYLVPIYPVLFAAGGVAWQQLRNGSRYITVMAGALLVTGAIIFPMAVPVLRPEPWMHYTQTLHLVSKTDQRESADSGPLPQFYADRFGWQELTDKVATAYRSLSPADQARAGIYGPNYGDASSINFLGESYHLPFAISGHNNYYLWGPHGYTGEVMILVSSDSPEDLREFYRSVEVAGRVDHPYSMPYEHRTIYIARGRKINLTADWPQFKHFE
ncbi:MAG TPA: glycosyltransferase family 39 protein [Acidisarcina sp.]